MAISPYTSLSIDNCLSWMAQYRAGSICWRTITCVWLAFWVLVTVLPSLHWQQVNDPAQLSYACFLMDHGMSPYRDLIEMNMPGIYLTNWTVMHTLGTGSLAWRLFDLGLMTVASLAMISIARPYDWFAGALAATMFVLFHVRDGAMQMGQRDLIIAVMLVCAHAFLFRALRSGPIWLMAGFGLAMGLAATIKPTPAPYAFLLLVLAALRFQRCGARWIRAVLLSVGGMIVPIAIVVAFLAAKNSLADFLWVVRWTLPYYAALDRHEWIQLLHKISPSVWGFAIIAALIFVLEWRVNGWRLTRRAEDAPASNHRADVECWEMRVLALGVLFGVASHFAQGKGTSYHRYPLIAFVFLLSGVCIARALRRQGAVLVPAVIGIAYGLVLAPCYAHELKHANWSTVYIDALTADLNQLGGSALNGKVQCVTPTYPDCPTTLYRMRLVQSTGLFYDFLIFGPGTNPVIQHWRTRFWQELKASPPDVFVVHSGQYPNNDGYIKLSKWPEFASYLECNYVLYTDRSFPSNQGNVMAYRIYIRKDSRVLLTGKGCTSCKVENDSYPVQELNGSVLITDQLTS